MRKMTTNDRAGPEAVGLEVGCLIPVAKGFCDEVSRQISSLYVMHTIAETARCPVIDTLNQHITDAIVGDPSGGPDLPVCSTMSGVLGGNVGHQRTGLGVAVARVERDTVLG